MKLKQLTRSMLYNKTTDQNGNHPQSICNFVTIALTVAVNNDKQNNITTKTESNETDYKKESLLIGKTRVVSTKETR